MSSEKTTIKSLGDSVASREKFYEFSQAALNKVNEIYASLSKPCIVIEDVRQLCREARGILYNPPVDEVPIRNCDKLSAEECKRMFAKEMTIYLPPEATDNDRTIATLTANRVIDALYATAQTGDYDGSK